MYQSSWYVYRVWRRRALGFAGRDVRQVLDHLLGVLCLSGTGLSGTQDTLVLTVCKRTTLVTMTAKGGVYRQALGFASRDIRQVCTGSHCCWAPSSRHSSAQDSLIRSVNKQANLGGGVRMGYEGGGHKAQNIKERYFNNNHRIVVIIHFQFWDLNFFIIKTIIFLNRQFIQFFHRLSPFKIFIWLVVIYLYWLEHPQQL